MPRGLPDKRLREYQELLHLADQRYKAECEPIVDRMTAYFRGNQWPKFESAKSIPPFVVNFLFADVKVMVPALSLRAPRVFCKPTQATTLMPDGRLAQLVPTVNAAGQPDLVPIPVIEAAQAKERLVNWRWRELRTKYQIRRALIDALLAPFGMVKLGYTVETEKIDTSEEPELVEANELIKANAPFAVRWSPKDVRVDCEARYPDLSDARFVAFGWTARVEDVKKNPRFKNTRNLRSNTQIKTDFGAEGSTPASHGRAGGMGMASDFYERVQLWELWDKMRHKRIVLADDYESELEYVDWPHAYENFPAETLCFTEHPDQLYGPPDLYQILYQQDGYNQTTALAVNHIRRFLRKYLVKLGTLDEKEKEKFELPIDGLMIDVNDADPSSAVVPLKDANIPADWWTGRASLLADHDRISSISDFARGVAEKVDTATEAGIIQSNMSIRINDSRDVVEDFAARISRQLLAIDAQTFDPHTMIPVVGPDGALALGKFITVESREQLQAETDVEVEIGSMQPQNVMRRKQDVLQLYAILRGDAMVNQFKLRAKLSNAFKDSVPDIEQLFYSPAEFQRVMGNMQQLSGGQAGGPPPGNGQPGPAPAPAAPPGAPQPVPPRVF